MQPLNRYINNKSADKTRKVMDTQSLATNLKQGRLTAFLVEGATIVRLWQLEKKIIASLDRGN
jgi:hypothetical protein